MCMHVSTYTFGSDEAVRTRSLPVKVNPAKWLAMQPLSMQLLLKIMPKEIDGGCDHCILKAGH